MNVQFSMSATTVNSIQNKSEVVSSNVIAPTVVDQQPPIRDTKEIGENERKETRVTVAEEQLIKNIERAVRSLQGPQTTLEISIHEKTHDIMVKVLNKETGELIREVPREKTLDLVAKMMEIAGILVDEKI